MLNYQTSYKRWKKNSQQKTQKTIDFFTNKIFSKPLKRIYSRNKTDVYDIDDIWSSDILDLKTMVLELIKVIDMF